VVINGVDVGKVRDISSLPGGGVRLNVDLQKPPVARLTDKLDIDFRPVNYFGVTGINLIPGTGGQTLRDGMRIHTVPKGNFTLQALLSRLGQLSTGVLTPQLIQTIDRATRYVDGLDPLIETALIVANAVAKTQTVPTARLLTNATGLSVAFPPFVDSLTEAGADFLHPVNYIHVGLADVTDDVFTNKFVTLLEESSKGLFLSIGKLESAHIGDLLPVVQSIKALTDVVPPLIRPEAIAQMLVELRSRLEKMYAGTPEQRALQVRIVLDSLPGVAAPIAAVGGP
jgi:hypothetical protein